MADIKVTDLDFDILKENLKDFLRGQEELQDYDFDGSGLQILLDILSANTHYNAIYQNMIANEMFLDSAVLRESVVSRAKTIGYTPSSIKSSEVEVTLSMIESIVDKQPNQITLPPFSSFSATKDGVTYIFQNTEGRILSNLSNDVDRGKIYSDTFTIKQGIMIEQNFEINFQLSPDQRFIIDNQNVDIDTLIVSVNNDPQNKQATYAVSTLAENVVEVGPSDNVYWINENESGNYEIYFGNGRIGKKLEDGSQIKIQYLTTSGSIANNIGTGFSFSDIVTIDNSRYEVFGNVVNNSKSFGGSDNESIEDIRFVSPKYYEMQNRSVTALDYKYLVQKKYQNVDSIKVWGGEDNDPVYYGRVFISLKPKAGYFLTESAKQNIVSDIVKQYNVVTIDAAIVEPTFTFVDLTTDVKYNLREVPQGGEYIRSLVLTSISDFNQENLGKFDSYLRFSKLIAKIDDASDSIKSNISSIKIKNRVEVTLGVSSSYDSIFNSEIKPGSLQSSRFTYNGYVGSFLEDDSNGNISVYSYSGTVKIAVQNNIGTVDYIKGSIKLSGFSPTEIESGESYIDVISIPQSFDLTPLRNQIILIDEDTININMNNISEQFLTQNKF